MYEIKKQVFYVCELGRMEIKESSEYSKNQIIEFLWRKSGMEYLS